MISEVNSVISALDHSSQLVSLPTPQNTQIALIEDKLLEAIEQLHQIKDFQEIYSVILILNHQILLCFSYNHISQFVWEKYLQLLKSVPSLVLCSENNLADRSKLQNYIKRLNVKRNLRKQIEINLFQKDAASLTDWLDQQKKHYETITGSVKVQTLLVYNDVPIFKIQTSSKNIYDYIMFKVSEIDEENEDTVTITEHIRIILEEAKDLKITFDDLRQEKRKQEKQMLQKAFAFLEFLRSNGLEIASYKGNFEIGIRVQQFLEEVEQGIFLRLYVPHGRYQAEQLESFLQLIENYLQQVEKAQFYIDRKKTRHGIIYVFKGKDNLLNLDDVKVAISRFDAFMKLCQYDRQLAERQLISSGLSPTEATYLLSKFLKEYQRIELDVRHEFERKMLDLRQRFESDMLELTSGSQLTFSEPISPSALLSLSNNAGPISITISNSSLGNNPTLQSIVEQTLNGDITYTTEDKQLIDLFERYAERLEAIILKSQLELLKDKTAPDEERRTAKQKLKEFLFKFAPMIAESVSAGAVKALTEYIQKLITGT